jgi:RNA polymerase sigma-70 factor, ECF subfamily
MKTVDFTQHLLNVQSELFRFAFKLTADREEANDLLQETSLKALDNEEKFRHSCISPWQYNHVIQRLWTL